VEKIGMVSGVVEKGRLMSGLPGVSGEVYGEIST
jgi:hypothetical protein